MNANAYTVGQVVNVNNGQTAVVRKVYNGGGLGGCYFVESNTGARYTVRHDEIAPVGAPVPPRPLPLAHNECRVIARYDRIGRKSTDRTPPHAGPVTLATMAEHAAGASFNRKG